jgi:HTH-type transcriptional regulator / antitoxin HigA
MNEMTKNEYLPDFVSPPGETLEEVLELRGMSQADLAERTGRPKKTINEIVRGKAAITAETALQFELVLGIPAAFWTSREQQYQDALARSKEMMSLQGQSAWLKHIPYRAMINLGWLPEETQKAKQVQQVLAFFGVASPERWNGLWARQQAAFRSSPTLKSDPGAVAAWLRKGEIEAQEIQSKEFDSSRFKQTLQYVRSLTRKLPANFASLVAKECSAAGVRLVFVPELPGTRAWGATRWLNATTALIQLSLRYKTDDHLWFTFFHEAGHILLHGRRDYFVEAEDQEKNAKELEADSFAREWLIPNREYAVFKRLGAYSCGAINRFAYRLEIAPGIVVGCLQHDGLVPHNRCNELKKPIDFA